MSRIPDSRLLRNLGKPKPKAYLTRILPKQGMEALQKLLDLKFWEEEAIPPSFTIKKEIKEAEILISLLTDEIGAELMDTAPNLKLISQYTVGFDNIDVTAATEHGIYVTNTPGVLTDTVADFTFAIIALLTPSRPHIAPLGKYIFAFFFFANSKMSDFPKRPPVDIIITSLPASRVSRAIS